MKNYPIKETPNKKEYKFWEKSERSDDSSKTMCVEEIENGFLVKITKETFGTKFSHDCKKWYSETNPLEKEQPINKEKNSLMEAIEQFNKEF